MNILLDSHLLLWLVSMSERLPRKARLLIEEPANRLTFSAASIWEIAIKASRGRDDLFIDPHLLRRTLVDNGFTELVVNSDHALRVTTLPLLHGDPFDRILVAQAMVEGMTLLTSDRALARYPGPILHV